VNDHSHDRRFTAELEDFLFEKSACLIASENFAIISCFKAPSKGYSVQLVSVILKYHISFFLQFSVSGEYSQGHFGNEANTADCATDNLEAETPKKAFDAASTQNELFQNSI
jgi:hypothetical protein